MDKIKIIWALSLTSLVAFLVILLVLNNIGVFFVIFVVPIAIPITYGYITGDRTTSVLLGGIPISIAIILPNLSQDYGYGIQRWVEVFTYSIITGLVCSLEGYFSSKQNRKSLLISLCFSITGIMIFLSGID